MSRSGFSAIEAARTGLDRALGSWRLLTVVWLVNLLVAAPAAVSIASSIRSSVGESRTGELLVDGFDMDWHGEFVHEARGLERSFTPSALVGGGWLDNLDAWWSGEIFKQERELVAFGALFALTWIVLMGGVLVHFNRERSRLSLGGLLSDGGGLFPRFLRLALLSAPIYFGIYRLARWLFPWIERATIDMTVERTVLFYNLLGVALIVFLVVTTKLIFDYARVAMVVEERRSAIFAVFRGLSFVLRRPFKTYGLVLLLALLGALLLVVYTLVTPGAGHGSILGMLAVFVLGQVFLVLRLILRLGLLGGELALFRESL